MATFTAVEQRAYIKIEYYRDTKRVKILNTLKSVCESPSPKYALHQIIYTIGLLIFRRRFFFKFEKYWFTIREYEALKSPCMTFTIRNTFI